MAALSPPPELSDHEQAAIKAAGWHVPTGARYLGGGGGGDAYVCFHREFLDPLVKGFTSHGAGETATEAAVAIADGIAEHFVWKGTGRAVIKIQKKIEPRTIREISAMQRVSHPHLMRILAHDPADTPRWFVMEHHPGGTLEEVKARYVGKPLEVFEALLPLADAVVHLHQAGLAPDQENKAISSTETSSRRTSS